MNLLLPTVRATRPTCYILLDSVMPVKLTINYKCRISLYILSFVHLFRLSLDTDSTTGGVSAQPDIASLSLLHTCLDSGVDNSQLCNMHIVKAYLWR